MANFSFTSNGSTPQKKPVDFGAISMTPKTPVGKALASPFKAGGSNLTNQRSIGSILSANTQQFNPATQAATGGFPTTPRPVTTAAPKPVDFSQKVMTDGLIPKSQTVKNIDGSQHTTVYHAPAQSNAISTGTTKPAATTETAPTQTQGTTPTQGTFPGYLSSLNQATSQALPQTQQSAAALSGALTSSPAAQNYTQQTADYGAGNLDIGKQAQNIASNFGKRYEDVGRAGARAYGGYLTTGTSPVAEGNAAVIAQTTAAQQQAIAEGGQMTLQGTAQQLTGQGQAATAANAAAGQANVGLGLAQAGTKSAAEIARQQQETTQSGLTSAATLAQPSPSAYGQTVFNPVTGQYEGGGGLPPEVMAQYAQMAANGQIASIPASITGNPVLSAQLNAAAKQINPAYNPITSAAQGASAGSLTQQASDIQAQANGAEQNFNLMLNLAKQGGVNDQNVPILNTLQQNVQRGLTSSAAVANFQSLIQSVRSQYAAILGGGTITVEALHEAQSLIPDDVSISALDSLGENLKKDATNRVVGIQQQINSLSGGNQGGSYQTSGSSGGTIVQTKAGAINTDW